MGFAPWNLPFYPGAKTHKMSEETPQPTSDIPPEKPKRVNWMKGKRHAPDKKPYSRTKSQRVKVEELAQAIAKDTLKGTIGKNDSFISSLGKLTQADRDALYRISGSTVDAFNAMLKGQLALAATKLTARMAGDEFVESLKPGEVAFAMTTAVQAQQKIGATQLTQGNITQVNVFAGPQGKTKEQIIRALQGLPDAIEVKANA